MLSASVRVVTGRIAAPSVSETGRMPSDPRPARHQVVVAAMLLRADAILLCHRSVDREWYPDLWDLPGGHIEEIETPTEALVRELQEEVGITLSEPLGPPSFYRATEDFEMQIWTSRQWSGSPANCAPQEHDEIGWFSEREVRSLRFADDAYRSWITQALTSG
jgi:8-oxo-dGTP diphosphatase